MKYNILAKVRSLRRSWHVLGLAWLSFCPPTHQDLPARQNSTHSAWFRYYPLAVGNTWCYRVQSSEKRRQPVVKWKMTQVDESKEEKSFTVWESPSAGDEGMQLVLSRNGVVNSTTGFYLIKFPANAGDEWKYEIDSIRQGRKVAVAYRIVSVGSPCRSGTFEFDNCLVVEETDGDINLRTTTYYAIDVGPVKHVYSELELDGGKKASTQTLELMSYKVQPSPKAD